MRPALLKDGPMRRAAFFYHTLIRLRAGQIRPARLYISLWR